MRTIMLLLLLVMTDSVCADYKDVYKCQSSSKQIVYQAEACSPAVVNQTVVEIKTLNAQQLKEAEDKLKATEAERLALDKADQETAKQQLRAQSMRRNPSMTNPMVSQGYNRRVYHPVSRYHYRFPTYQPSHSTNQFGFPASNMHTMRTPNFSSNRKFR